MGPEQAVLYDGRCGLCQASVAFARARDRHQTWTYIPNQSEHGQALLRRYGRLASSHHTLVVVKGSQALVRSSGVLAMLRGLGGPWPVVAALLWLIPRPLRDAGYRFVAARRHRGAKTQNLSA